MSHAHVRYTAVYSSPADTIVWCPRWLLMLVHQAEGIEMVDKCTLWWIQLQSERRWTAPALVHNTDGKTNLKANPKCYPMNRRRWNISCNKCWRVHQHERYFCNMPLSQSCHCSEQLFQEPYQKPDKVLWRKNGVIAGPFRPVTTGVLQFDTRRKDDACTLHVLLRRYLDSEIAHEPH